MEHGDMKEEIKKTERRNHFVEDFSLSIKQCDRVFCSAKRTQKVEVQKL